MPVLSFPLPHDDANVATLLSAADDARTAAHQYSAVADALKTRARVAAGQTEGSLPGLITESVDPTARSADELALAATVAGATTFAFAQAVQQHNRVIDGLNAEYEWARRRDFGVIWGAGLPADAAKAEQQQRYDLMWDDANLALRHELTRRAMIARDQLEAEGDRLASALSADPSSTLVGLAEDRPTDTAWWSFLAPLEWVLRRAGVLPAENADDPVAYSEYGFGLIATGLGTRQDWLTRVRYGRYAPRVSGPGISIGGQFVSVSNSTAAQRLAWSMRWKSWEKDWIPKANNKTTYARAGTVGKWVGRAGSVVTAGLAGWEQWQEDADNPTLDDGERIDRTATKAATTGTIAAGGAWGGALVGGAIGTAICPGIGTVIGGAIGGLAGAWAGGEVGGALGDLVNDRFDGAGHAVKSGTGWIKGKLGL